MIVSPVKLAVVFGPSIAITRELPSASRVWPLPRMVRDLLIWSSPRVRSSRAPFRAGAKRITSPATAFEIVARSDPGAPSVADVTVNVLGKQRGSHRSHDSGRTRRVRFRRLINVVSSRGPTWPFLSLWIACGK